MIMPVLTMALGTMASKIRYVRANTIGQLSEEYVLASKAKGCTPAQILRKHVLKNTLLPIITILGMNMASLVCGSFIIESVFGWPGVGSFAMEAIGKRDYLNVFGNDYPTPDGTGVRDYIHVVDLAKGHVAAIQYLMTHTGEGVFNLGTGHGYSVLDMVHAFEEANGVKVPYEVTARRPGDLATCYADPAKSLEVLGWKAEKNLVDMCRDTWNWQKQNPNGYEQ